MKSTIDELLRLKEDFKKVSGKDWTNPGARSKKTKDKNNNKADQPSKNMGCKETGRKQTRLGIEAKKANNLPDWYSEVITKSELISYYDVSGCYILRPWAYSIWEEIQVSVWLRLLQTYISPSLLEMA